MCFGTLANERFLAVQKERGKKSPLIEVFFLSFYLSCSSIHCLLGATSHNSGDQFFKLNLECPFRMEQATCLLYFYITQHMESEQVLIHQSLYSSVVECEISIMTPFRKNKHINFPIKQLGRHQIHAAPIDPDISTSARHTKYRKLTGATRQK